MTNIVLGVNNGFAAKFWPQPDEWARLIAETMGLKYVQFSFDLLHPLLPEPERNKSCKQILDAVSRFGLSLDTTFSGLVVYAHSHLAHPDPAMRAFALEWYKAAIDVTSFLGAEGTGGHIGALSALDYADPTRRERVRQELIKSVIELTHHAHSLGQSYFLWELMPSPHEIPHTPAEAIELLVEVNREAVVPVRLAFDLGHCCGYDLETLADPHQWLEQLLPWTSLVHLQQTDGYGDHHWPFTQEHAHDGIIDPQRVVEIVKSSPAKRVDLLFELCHSPEASPQQVLDNHCRSIEVWTHWI